MKPAKRNRLLERQIRRYFAADAVFPAGWDRFLDAIEAAYRSAEDDRIMLERSLELSSQELLEANRTLRDSSDAAQAATVAKSEFLATMSHEIRTPLNGILGMTQLLRETELDEEQQEFARTVDSSARSLLAIINDILDFSKIEAGRVEYELVETDLHAVVDETMGVVANLRPGELELTALIRREVPRRLCCDPVRVRQILLNLLSNAIKFTPEGSVGVRVDRCEIEGEPFLSFEVSDTGIGIPADRLERLFSPFCQVDASTTRRYGGTGLGLTISKRFAEGMGGDMGVRSVAGEGSTFWFRLPLLPVDEAEVKPTFSGRRVLVADDYAVTRESIAHYLESWGVVVDEARNGREALECLERSPARWDLALLDLRMADIDGDEILARLQARGALHSLRCVLMTSSDEISYARKLVEDLRCEVIAKPIRYDALERTLRQAFEEEAECGEATVEEGSELAILPCNRVLVAEDNKVNQRVISMLLDKLGQQCVLVDNGREAIEALEAGRFDIVFMDLMMPEVDGLDATRIIRTLEEERGGHVPIVALTADARTETRDLCLEAGADDFCTKPVSKKALHRAIARWCPCSSPTGE